MSSPEHEALSVAIRVLVHFPRSTAHNRHTQHCTTDTLSTAHSALHTTHTKHCTPISSSSQIGRGSSQQGRRDTHHTTALSSHDSIVDPVTHLVKQPNTIPSESSIASTHGSLTPSQLLYLHPTASQIARIQCSNKQQSAQQQAVCYSVRSDAPSSFIE